MKIIQLNNNSKSIINTNDIAKILNITFESAKVTAARYTKKGYLIRLKRDFYVTANKFEKYSERDFFRAANIIQVPSYISLISALSYYDITTQQFQNVYESVAVKRSKNVIIKNVEFVFYRLKTNFYFGFGLAEDFFIASPEKAFADIIYLTSLGKYRCDFTAINFKKIDKNKVEKFLQFTNNRTKLYWEKLCKIYNP